MRRIAIDFGTTGIRTATMADGRVSCETLTVKPSISAIAALLGQFADQPGVDITLSCTNQHFHDQPHATWTDLASRSGGRAFRVLGDSPEESPALGVARQLATQLRCKRLAVVEAGAAHAAFAVVGTHGRPLAFDAWRFDSNAAPTDFVTERVRAILGKLRATEQDDTAEPLGILGIGGAGPEVVARLIGSMSGLSSIEQEHANLLPTIGILCANIVRTFETSLDGRIDRDELTQVFLRLMDQSYDAITREGYDLDDADCIREVLIQSTDARHSAWIECGMNIDIDQLLIAFARSGSAQANMPTGVNARIVAARVTATIEPVRPSLSGIVVA